MSKQDYQSWRREQVYNMLMEKFVPTSKRKLKEVVSELTPEQNMGIKKLYLIIKSIITQLIESLKIHKDMDKSELLKFQKNNSTSFPHDAILKGYAITFPVPEEIKKLLPNLDNTFELKFNGQRDEAGLETMQWPGEQQKKIISLEIGWDLIRDGSEHIIPLLSTIQHELQHIVDFGGKVEDNTIIDIILYLTESGEVSAHAKQYAYLYHKIYPQDMEIDMNKLKTEFLSKIPSNRSYKKILNYLNFASEPEAIASRNNLPEKEKYIKMMKEAGDDFIVLMKRYLKLFKKTIHDSKDHI